MMYYKSKLKEKLDIIFKSKGLEPIDIDDSIFNIKLDGRYQIVWNSDKSKILRFEKLKGKPRIFNGLYYIDGKSLASSQYIEFSLQEARDFKIESLFLPKSKRKKNERRRKKRKKT